jgi:hypothetical protein
MRTTFIAAFTMTIATLCAGPAAAKDPPGVNPEHYACYKVSPAKPFKAVNVALADQFGKGAAVVVQEMYLCAPVSKNEQPIKDETTHLLCYTLKTTKAANKAATITNQFGSFVMKIGALAQLCVPSLKKLM